MEPESGRIRSAGGDQVGFERGESFIAVTANETRQHPFERPDPDLDIVRLAQRRATRREAMGVLYERFRERVFNVALRIVGDREEAADILQDVFILLFRKIHRFRARARFASWVYRISVNVSLDHLRRRRRNPTPAGDSRLIRQALFLIWPIPWNNLSRSTMPSER